MGYTKRPSGPAFNPNRVILDLPTIEAARLGEAAKRHGKSSTVLAALIVSDWIKTHTPALSLDGKPIGQEPDPSADLVAKFSTPAAPMVSNVPDTTDAIRQLEMVRHRPRPLGMV